MQITLPDGSALWTQPHVPLGDLRIPLGNHAIEGSEDGGGTSSVSDRKKSGNTHNALLERKALGWGAVDQHAAPQDTNCPVLSIEMG